MVIEVNNLNRQCTIAQIEINGRSVNPDIQSVFRHHKQIDEKIEEVLASPERISDEEALDILLQENASDASDETESLLQATSEILQNEYDFDFM